ncbi:MAG: LysM peptidoglycan-binding domain-containing protein [Ruminococcus sp.]|nr:LysM peptidoglycan-binding domain-containing protein [Ruminococcus sp.]MCM1381481.1 LysM peptidoglycan-binding domain-containing protein [Muribaculaceae bacterium]MCM1481011.1 LysM peptidoglycan-binding domain-containing protein [Muribaculaceae bacterium]
MEIYVVQAGDTVYSIARKFGVSEERLVSDNAIDPSRTLVTGQALLILKPRVIHTFARGESLFSIAESYGTSLIALYRNNPSLIGHEYIETGTEITVRFEDEPVQKAKTSGFAYSYINRRVLEHALPYLTYLILFGYGFNEDGSIITLNGDDMIYLAHSYRTAVLLSFTSINPDGSFGSGKIERLLTDIDFQNTVIANFIKVIEEKGAQGLDIDIEYIPPQFREEFAAFAENCRRQLRDRGLIVHVDLAPKISPDQQGLLYEAHDYGLLGAAADYVFLMTYEWGYTSVRSRCGQYICIKIAKTGRIYLRVTVQILQKFHV